MLTPTALSTVGLRRATEARVVKVRNRTGFDIHLLPNLSGFDFNAGAIANNDVKTFDTVAGLLDAAGEEEISFCMRLSQSTIPQVGEREPVFNLKVSSAHNSIRTYLLRPVATFESINPGRASLLRLLEGRGSPETILTDMTSSEIVYHNAEPVVEWCMHNQRLRSSIVDAYSLEKGQDLLSASIWSPEDGMEEDSDLSGDELTDRNEPEAAAGLASNDPSGALPAKVKKHSNWLRPYLKNDSPEWTDMTCTLRMARERVMLPDSRWMWVNEWTVDLSGSLGESTDSDGWEYSADFETFTRTRRYYERGDSCRRRRWTRTRIVAPPRLGDPLRQLKFVWETSTDEDGNYSVAVRSHVSVKNATAAPISFFVYCPSWDEDIYIGTADPGMDQCVPVNLASSAVYMRLAKRSGSQEPQSIRDCISSKRFIILPTSHTSSNFVRTSMDLKDVSRTTLHFLVEIQSTHGIVDITIHPVLRLINLLPCQLECQFGEVIGKHDNRIADKRETIGRQKKIAKCETLTIASGKEGACTAISPWRAPHVSLRVPGYEWSRWHRIVNRKANSYTWRPSEKEEESHSCPKSDADIADELKTVVHFRRVGVNNDGDPLNLIFSVECDHCPTLRVYSQYWILDKTGFGCRFAEGFSDMLGSVPDSETSRRSHLPPVETKDSAIRRDMTIAGHQWSIGMSGMSLYFSTREKITLAIETGVPDRRKVHKNSLRIKSKWVSPLHISNVMPKTVFSVDELNGPRRFELAISVTVCPGIFSRTKLITFLPRYQIVNLLHRELAIAQEECLETETRIPSQSALPFHLEKGSLPAKVRLGTCSAEENRASAYKGCWTNGCFQLDRVGITSMRLPTDNKFSKIPLVVQAEVRLATKEQSSAVVVVIWAANEKSNPLYVLRNRTPYTILCRQPLHDESPDAVRSGRSGPAILDTCASLESRTPDFECNAEFGPLIKSFLGFKQSEEFVWVLKSNDVACFGFDDPEKPHILEWTCVGKGDANFGDKRKKAFLEVDAMGSASVLGLPGGRRVRCQIEAEHSTKVIEFQDFGSSKSAGRSNLANDIMLDSLRKRGTDAKEKGVLVPEAFDVCDDDEDAAFSFRLEIPGVSLSVVDNADRNSYGREIMLAQFEKLCFSFSQTREGYHEVEFRLNSLQVDNHVHKSIHPVLVSLGRSISHL